MLLHTYWLTLSLSHTHTHTLALSSTSTRAATALREHSSALQHASVRNEITLLTGSLDKTCVGLNDLREQEDIRTFKPGGQRVLSGRLRKRFLRKPPSNHRRPIRQWSAITHANPWRLHNGIQLKTYHLVLFEEKPAVYDKTWLYEYMK